MSIPYRQTWTLQHALDLCVKIESVCPEFGCHVALTGGVLYKPGPRKDCDILFYRIRQAKSIDIDGLRAALATLGIVFLDDHGFVKKATYGSRHIDFLFPEEESGEYYPPLGNAVGEPLLICDKSTS
jgi:hypothetical protein